MAKHNKFSVEYLQTHPGFYWLDCNYEQEVQVVEIVIDPEYPCAQVWLQAKEYPESLSQRHADYIIDECPIPQHVKEAVM